MDGLVLKEIVLNKERMTIGRRPSNDIQIDNLAISGEHAVVVTILNDSFLEDLNSTNGTLVNSQPITKHFLKDGDVVELGKYKLKYIADASSSGDPSYKRSPERQPAAPTPEPEPAAEPASASVPAPLPAAAAATDSIPAALTPAALGFVQVLNGAKAGRELKLTKELTTLGKPGRQVAVIARRPEGYFITHVEGASFPTVNGTMIDVQAHLLRNHDVIEIAGIKMEFFLKE
jgi:pSer/pThr/pTyr-binding forkhead associated (FHA) protein